MHVGLAGGLHPRNITETTALLGPRQAARVCELPNSQLWRGLCGICYRGIMVIESRGNRGTRSINIRTISNSNNPFPNTNITVITNIIASGIATGIVASTRRRNMLVQIVVSCCTNRLPSLTDCATSTASRTRWTPPQASRIQH